MNIEDKKEPELKQSSLREAEIFVKDRKIYLKDVLCLIAVAVLSAAVLMIDHPIRQAPPIVSYLTFTGFQLRR